MIRVVMLGRTGNNLFQYAFGRALAEHHGVPLLMDGSMFDRRGWSSVSSIQRLPIDAIVRRRFPIAGPLCKKLLHKHPWELLHPQSLCEPYGDHSFRAEFLNAGKRATLAGFFQSPLYFAGYEETIRRDLDMSALQWDPITKELARSLSEPDTVAIHVRRTDYRANRDVNFIGQAYYESAIQEIKQLVPGCRLFLFSDDPAAALKDFELEDKIHCVVSPTADPLRDLHLMSLASHQIISNSTYSWWAAWLGKKAGQEVLVPNRWYRDASIAPIGEKLVPGWRTVPV